MEGLGITDVFGKPDARVLAASPLPGIRFDRERDQLLHPLQARRQPRLCRATRWQAHTNESGICGYADRPH